MQPSCVDLHLLLLIVYHLVYGNLELILENYFLMIDQVFCKQIVEKCKNLLLIMVGP